MTSVSPATQMVPAPRLPLAGIRVVDFTQVVAGPHATLWLAAMGAEVIKIEAMARPDQMRLSQIRPGEEASYNKNPLFVVTNFNKRSFTLNVATPDGAELCRQLVARSDIVVESFSPGVIDRFGLGYEVLSRVNPRIIMASLAGYGHTGAFAGFLAFAPNIQAFSGLSGVTGYPDGDPEQIFLYYADIPCGQMMTLAILAALEHRRRTGRGQYIDVAMSEAMIALNPEPVLVFGATGVNLGPNGNREPGSAPHGCYPALGGDDAWIAIAARTDAQWAALVAELGREGWLRDPRFATVADREAAQDELDAMIGDATRTRDAQELAAALQARGIAAAPSQTARDLLTDPHLADRNFFFDLDHPELGSAKVPRVPWRCEGFENRPNGTVPDLGQDTEYVLTEILGIPAEEIPGVREQGIVGR